MILNEILSKQNVINAILLNNKDLELSKELKVKIVRLRIAYNRIKAQVDADIQEFTKDLIPDELKNLQAIPENTRTVEDNKKLQELVNKVNLEYKEFMEQKGLEEISTKFNDDFSEEDFDEIVAVNAGNELNINGNNVKGEDLMEVFYTLFVNKN